MDKKGNDPLREELRSSQVYHVLKGSGIPVAGKIAQGLDKAAQGLDQVVEGFSAGVKSNRGAGAGHPYRQSPPVWQAPPQQRPPQTAQPPRGAAPGNGTRYQAPPPNGYYRYNYTQGRQAPPPVSGTRPGPRPQGGAGARPQAQARPQPQAQPQAQVPMKLVHTGSPAKFYITGAAALFYAMVAPLYEPQHFIIFLLVLVLVFLGSGALFKGKKVFVPIEPEKPKEEPKAKPEKEEKSQTGNPEVDKIIDEGREYLKKLRAADDAIPDEALSEDITRMERASADIFRYIADHPEKAPQIRKFMNYYLPTTLKLLNSYQRLSAQSVKGENITSTMFNIAGMMHTVADAFEKQLDALFSQEAMDISADITVFETLLKQEGFVEEEKKEGTL